MMRPTLWKAVASGVIGSVLIVSALVSWSLSAQLEQCRQSNDRIATALLAAEQRTIDLDRANTILQESIALIRQGQIVRDARIAALEAARRQDRRGPTPVFCRP